MKSLLYFKSVLAAFALSCGSCTASESTKPVISTEGNIARLTAGILEESQYSHHPLDGPMAGKFLDRFIEGLDGQHLDFFQTDLDEFSAYRGTLDKRTKAGDTSPAHRIYERFLQRVQQRVAYTIDLLSTETFEFDGEDTYTVDRRGLPRPADLDQAQQCWRQRLRYEYLQEKLNGKEPVEISTTLSNRYSGLLRTARDVSDDEVTELYLTALANAYDPHSDYLGRSEFESLSISMRLSLFGIGAELISENGYPKIARLLPGPAARSKQLKPGDRIIAVAQEGKKPLDVIDMPIARVADLIRGPKGTQVWLTVIPSDAADPASRKIVMLTREEIKLADKEAKAKIIELPDGRGQVRRLGVLDLPSFYEDMDGRDGPHHKSTTEDVSRLLKKLKQENIGGLILDLRQNGGGSLEEAINLTGLFIKKGPVVQVKDSNGKISVAADKNASALYEGPLIVLVSRFSASASEILAGALQDYERALIVGDSSTFGKGTVQSVLELAPLMRRLGMAHEYDPGGLLVTIQKFYRPGGASTQLRGVSSDIVLPSLSNYAETGESSLYNPLPWDQIRSAKFEKWNRVQPFVDELRRRSAKRVAADLDFAYLREDIGRLKQSLAEKEVSLNEAQRRAQIDDAKARNLARKTEREKRAEPDWKVFELTLENMDRPAPLTPTGRTDPTASGDNRQTPPASEESSVLTSEFSDGMIPALDIVLQETERILADYVALWK